MNKFIDTWWLKLDEFYQDSPSGLDLNKIETLFLRIYELFDSCENFQSNHALKVDFEISESGVTNITKKAFCNVKITCC